MNKKFLLSIIFIIGFMGSSLAVTSITPVTTAKTSSVPKISSTATSGMSSWTTIPGTNISYRSGLNTFNAQNTFQVSNSGTSIDSYSNQAIQDATVNLVNLSTVVVQKFYYHVVQSVYPADPSVYSALTSVPQNQTFDVDNATYQSYVGNLTTAFNVTGVSSFNLVINGRPSGIVNTAIVTNTGEYVGTFPTNASFTQADYSNFANASLNFNMSHLLQITAMVISYTPIMNVPVQVNYTLSVNSVFSYFNLYNVTYNIKAEQWLAQIRDGNRMALSVSAFKDLQMNYTEIRFSVLDYYISSFLNVTLTNLNTGQEIPFNETPFSLRPAYFEQNGSVSQIGMRFINTTSLMASTTAVQAFHTKIAQSLNSSSYNSTSFVDWMVSSTPRLLAYKDGNLNNQLDLQYDPSSGLQVAGGDTIPYVGLLEATKGNAITYQSTNQTYDQHIYTWQGLQFINNTQLGVTQNSQNYNVFHYGFGNTSQTPSLSAYFNPVVNKSNTFEFTFGVDYQNFPVSWVNTTNGQTIISPMNVSYDYVFDINPYLGTANLSPTVTYGAITNPVLQNAFQGLSLATMYQSDFLSVATIRATNIQKTDQNLTSSVTTNFASISFSGPQNNFTSVGTSGAKAYYTLNGVKYKTNTTDLNIASFAGTSVSQNVTVFQSDTQSLAGSAMMQNTTITGVKLNYRRDLILVSYPEWNGGKIIHDPTFSAVYQQSTSGPAIIASSTSSTVTSGTSVALQWQVTDQGNVGGTYVIKDETGTVIQSGNWQPGNKIYLTVTPTVGTHTYTLTITDTQNFTASSGVKVTVTQATSSTPTNSTSNQTTYTPPVSTTTINTTGSLPGFTFEVMLMSFVVSVVFYLRRRHAK